MGGGCRAGITRGACSRAAVGGGQGEVGAAAAFDAVSSKRARRA